MRAVGKAPSKAILIGEHFVVHGAEAVAAALPIYSMAYAYNCERLEIESKGYSYSSLKPVERTIISICREFKLRPAARIVIESDIPRGSGLGSSASILVASASAFMRLNGIEPERDAVFRYALEGEKEIHGKPSGIDPAACSYGGIIRFRAGGKVNIVDAKSKICLAVVDSGKRRRTYSLIERVGRMKRESSGIFSSLSRFVDTMARDASKAIENHDMERLGLLMTANHAILSFIGVSTPELDRIVEIMLKNGSYGAKITGAGGGGCVIAAVEPEGAKEIQNTLGRQGYRVFNVELPAGGFESWLE